LNTVISDDFNHYYRLSIADTVITFVLQVVYMVVMFFGLLRDSFNERFTPAITDVPLSNRHF
jgi:uncharacterized membrane protein